MFVPNLSFSHLSSISSITLFFLQFFCISFLPYWSYPQLHVFSSLSTYIEREEKLIITITTATCYRELQAMHIHGGGPATSEPNNPNGWNKISKVSFFFSFPSFYILKLYDELVSAVACMQRISGFYRKTLHILYISFLT